SQVIRKIRNWVNETIGSWLFPGREDLRFYVALEFEKIRVAERSDDPENVVIHGPGWTYARRDGAPVNLPGSEPPPDPQFTLNTLPILHPQLEPGLSAKGITSTQTTNLDTPQTPPDPSTVFPTPEMLRTGARIVQLMILWEKTKKLRAATKALR